MGFLKRKRDHSERCPCVADQDLINAVYIAQTSMEARLDPAWFYRCRQMARQLKDDK